jgi:hypothetical protein
MGFQPFYLFLFIHLVSFIVGFGSVITVDTFGSLWILKKVKLSTVNTVANVSEKLIWLGWGGLVASGACLLYIKSDGYSYIDELTMIKIFFVALLGLNGLFLAFIKKSTAHLTDDMEMPKLARFRITLASTISQLGWWSALIIGFLHRQIASTINWPPKPFLVMAVILLAIGAIALVGETVLRPKVAKVETQKPQAN